MKNLFLLVSVFFGFLFHAQDENSKKVEPSLEVQKAFEKDFPKATAAWTIDDRDQLSYEGDFTQNHTEMTAIYSAAGELKVLEIGMKVSDVPFKVSNYLAQNYPKNKINNAARAITGNSTITYEIGITINDRWTDAIFNKEGDFLRMVQKD